MHARPQRGWPDDRAIANDTDPPDIDSSSTEPEPEPDPDADPDPDPASSPRARRASARPLLVGDDLDNPGNIDALIAVADMFGWEHALLVDDRHPAARGAAARATSRVLAAHALAERGEPIIAIENAAGAQDLFSLRAPAGRYVVVVGNERRGISRDLLRRADRVAQIPCWSPQLNTLNVAAAAAIAAYHLSGGGGGRRGPRGRPDVLLAAPTDPIELGSAIRSAACFGWTRLFVDDRDGVWFDTDRVTRSLGRGAARRGRNPIHVVPALDPATYDEVLVVRTDGRGPPLRATALTGPRRLIVIPGQPGAEAAWAAGARPVREVRLDVAVGARTPLRLVASIVLAEVARQLGEPPRPSRRWPIAEDD